MSSKYDGKDGKESYSDDEKAYEDYDSKSSFKDDKDTPPSLEITAIKIDGSCRPVSDPLDLSITFEVDRYRFLCTYFPFICGTFTLPADIHTDALFLTEFKGCRLC